MEVPPFFLNFMKKARLAQLRNGLDFRIDAYYAFLCKPKSASDISAHIMNIRIVVLVRMDLSSLRLAFS